MVLSMIGRGRRDGDARETSRRVVNIRVRGGYLPDTIWAEAGVPLRLVFRRDESAPCSAHVVFPAFGRSATLPERKQVAIDLLPHEPGEYEFTGATGMLHGRIVIDRRTTEPAASAAVHRAPGRDANRIEGQQ